MKTNTYIDNQNLGELLTSYYQGKLSAKESQDLDSLKSQDEFLADSMEGFDEFPEAINHIPAYKSKSINKLWIAGGVVTILSLIALFVFYPQESEIKPLAQVASIEEVIESEQITEAPKPISSEKEIAVPVTKIKTIKNKETTKLIDKETPKRDYFEIPKMELNPIEIKQKTDYTIKKAKTKALLYYDFLAIDYSVIYTNTIPVEPNFGGIDASKPNKTEEGIEIGNGNQEKIITYKEQLKNSLYQLKVQNYTSAITNFEIILTHFPQDANAEFYIGYALFHQEKYEEAILYFEKAMANGFDFFFEDAEWFIANSLENMGKLKEAQKLYRKIKNKGGYYSYQVE